MTRVNVLDTPILAPGNCSLCGSSGGDDRQFIDIGKQLDWYGAVYFCSHCFREMSQGIGYIPVASFDKLHEDYRQLQIKYDQLEQTNGALKNAMASVLSCSGTVDSSVSDPVSAIVPSEEPNLAESEESNGSDSEATGSIAESESPDSVEGFDDLFDPSEFESD
jgi:hypothetical protein